MQLNNLVEAATFVKDELIRRNYGLRRATFINERRNMIFEVVNTLAIDESIFLKWEQRPYFGIGYEVEFPAGEKKGICINKCMFLDYIKPLQALILYALPDMIYHISYDDFEEYAVDHVQRFNNEPVYALPFSKLTMWIH